MSTSFVPQVARRRDLQLLALAVAAELLLLALYVLGTPAELTRVRYALYPFVWINVGVWAVLKARPPAAPRRRRLLAGVVSGLYLLVLFWLSGLVGVTLAGNPTELLGITVGYGSPGWERIRLVTSALYVTLIPFRVVGYLALAYLVYVTILDTAAAALSGAIGLVSCVSCSFPIFASLATGLFGSSAALTGAVYTYSVDLSTAVFLLAVALLYYRPGFERRTNDGPETAPRE